MNIGMGLSSGEKQLMKLANKKQGESISIDVLCNLDIQNRRLANKIIDELSLIKDETLIDSKINEVNLTKNPIEFTY